MSDKLGVQRYKYSVIVDLKGTGLNLLGGKRKAVLQQVWCILCGLLTMADLS